MYKNKKNTILGLETNESFTLSFIFIIIVPLRWSKDTSNLEISLPAILSLMTIRVILFFGDYFFVKNMR